MAEPLRIVRNLDLAPSWTVKQVKEPNFMRSVIRWAGGASNDLNENSRHAVTGW